MPRLISLVGAFRDHLRASTPSDGDLARHLPRALANPQLEFSIAWLEGEPVGYTQTRFFDSIWSLGTEAHLEDLFVVCRPAEETSVAVSFATRWPAQGRGAPAD